MARRITLPQLKKYDVTQKVIEMLADAESRAIIFSIIKKVKLLPNYLKNTKFLSVQLQKNIRFRGTYINSC